MDRKDVARHRLHNQRLARNPLASPEEVVRWLAAVQSQDFAGAKWALAQRTKGFDDVRIEALYDQGKILRTHVLRPTWHFVLPEDIRWLLDLTAPAILTLSGPMCKKLGIDDAVAKKSNDVIAKALEGQNHLTRAELGERLRQNGIDTDELRLTFLAMRAELDAVICNGPRRGNQFTYALLDERAPANPKRDREEAAADLARRFLKSHGPATVEDFSWWSGLSITNSRKAVAAVASEFESGSLEGRPFYWPAIDPPKTQTSHLLPHFDEFVVAYRDRSLCFGKAVHKNLTETQNALMGPMIVRNGHAIGSWRRLLAGKQVSIELNPFKPLTKSEMGGIERAASAYGRFLGKPWIFA